MKYNSTREMNVVKNTIVGMKLSQLESSNPLNLIKEDAKYLQFIDWCRDIRTESTLFNRMIEESFQNIKRISVISKRKNLGWTRGFLYFQDEYISFRSHSQFLFSRRYVWKYNDIIFISNNTMIHITLVLRNGDVFEVISCYNDIIMQTINTKKLIFWKIKS